MLLRTSIPVPEHHQGLCARPLGLCHDGSAEDRRCRFYTRYYTSSASLTASKAAEAVRDHWAIENPLHRVLDVVFKEDQARFGKDTAQGTWPWSAISPSTSSDIPRPCRPSQLASDGRPGTKPRHGPSASGSAARWPDGQRHTHQNPARVNLELAPTASTPAIVGAGWAARMAITVSKAICARRPCTTAAPEPNLWTKAG